MAKQFVYTNVGASEYGGPGDPTSGHIGSCGGNLKGKKAFAELNLGYALGHLPCGTQLYIEPINPDSSKPAVLAEKLDIGAYNPPIKGHARRIDIWWETAKQMGLPGNGTWTGLVRIRRADGKPIAGPGQLETEEAKGTGILGFGVGPDAAPETSEKVREAAEGLGSWTKELGAILHFIGSSSGWVRIGKVVLGAGLLVIALDQLTKVSPGPDTNIAGGAGRVVKGAKAAKKLGV